MFYFMIFVSSYQTFTFSFAHSLYGQHYANYMQITIIYANDSVSIHLRDYFVGY